jgi:AraC-like DNA-binding protein
LDQTVIGYLQTGQVLLHQPSENDFRAAMEQLSKWTSDLEIARWREAYFKTRVLTNHHYQAIVRLLTSFAQHLSRLSNDLVVRQASAEPVPVGRARAFIAQHLDEEISLALVARTVGTSSFYFCKLFKGATGLTFTDYLAHARVEKAKQLLLSPHMHISEAAFAAGFQSLSQFNRVFRRIEGKAPSACRNHQQSGAAAMKPSTGFSVAA